MDPRNELFAQRVFGEVPGMDKVHVIKDLVYLEAEDKALKLNIYQPADAPGAVKLPAIVFVHGEAPWELVQDVRDWGQYRDWGTLAAASGFVGVVICRRPSDRFTRLPEVAGDTQSALDFIREHAAAYGIDAERIGLWVCSAGGPSGLSPLLASPPAYLRSIAALYPALDLRPHKELLEFLTEEELKHYSPLYHLERSAKDIPPLLIVKAGQDNPFFNDPIDAFAADVLPKHPHFHYLVHEEGRHGFDVRDDLPRTREIVQETLEFFKRYLY